MKILHHVGLQLHGEGYIKGLGVLNKPSNPVLNIYFDIDDLGKRIKKIDLWIMRMIKR